VCDVWEEHVRGGSISTAASGLDFGREFTALNFGLGRFVAVGRGAIVYQSDLVIPRVQWPEFHLDGLPGGLLRLVVESPAGVLWIDASDDLKSWRPFSTIGIGTAGAPSWIDFELSGAQERPQFFRAKVTQP
jgi:hypothetical protein